MLTVDRDIAEKRYARQTVQIEQAKAAYYTSQIDKNKGDSKTLFKLTNSLTGKMERLFCRLIRVIKLLQINFCPFPQ